jgi:hypothetical protein
MLEHAGEATAAAVAAFVAGFVGVVGARVAPVVM